MSGDAFGIRYSAINEHYHMDRDKLRFKRELSRLELDIARSIKRHVRANDSCESLMDLHDFVCSKMED